MNLEMNRSQALWETGDFQLVVAHIEPDPVAAHMVRLATKFPWESTFARRQMALAVRLVDLQKINAVGGEVALDTSFRYIDPRLA